MSSSQGPYKTFVWQIENFSSYMIGRNRYLRSPSFTTPSGKELELEFFTGNSETSEFSLGLQYKNTCLGAPMLTVYVADLSILTKSGHDKAYVSKDGNPISGIKGHLFQPQDKIIVQCKIHHDVPQKCFARTVFLRENFLWVLPRSDFTYNTKMFQLSSTEFVMHINNYESEDKVRAKLCQVQESGENFRFPLCKVSAMGADGNVWSVLCEEYFLNKPWSFLIPMREEFVINDMLVLQWEFVIGLEETSNVKLPPIYDSEKGVLTGGTRNCLGSDLLNLYRDGKLCDVVLKAEGKSFPVHKCILSARSPVFCAMFERDMEEGRTGEVDIQDVDKDTLDRMLFFLYTDTLKVPHPTLGELHFEEACNLYYVADKYAILHLKEKCRSVLVTELSFFNVCEALSLADIHQDIQLMQSATTFVWENHNDVLSSQEWKNLEGKQPKLTAKLLHDMLIKRRM